MKRCVRRSFGRGEIVFHEGDPGDSLHLVESGRVAFRVTTPLGDKVLLNVIGHGDFFGEMALLGDSGRRTATAVCLDPVLTWAMRRPVFEQLCASYPEAAGLVRTVLVERIDRLSALL
ncbi:MAG: cyclic nucleotide-binding domain-containing protein, partial [Dehalococcoidia bacterium]